MYSAKCFSNLILAQLRRKKDSQEKGKEKEIKN
jgi:hypothetical protein